MINTMYTDDDFAPSQEYYCITNELRWNSGILEQKWVGRNGSEKWEVVPTLAETDDD